MRKLGLVLSLLFFGNVFAAGPAEKPALGLFVSSTFAFKLSAAQTYSGLADILPISDSDKKLFLSDVKAQNGVDSYTPNFEFRGTKLLFRDQSNKFEIDFQEINKGKLVLNAHHLDLRTPISYSKAKVLIQDLNGKVDSPTATLMSVFLSKASAEVSNSYPNFLAVPAIVISATQVFYSENSVLSQLSLDSSQASASEATFVRTLLASYETEASRFSRRNQKENEVGYETLIFDCAGTNLASVARAWPVREGRFMPPPSKKSGTVLVFDPKKGYSYIINKDPNDDKKCISKADVRGFVTEGGDGCPKRKENLFELPPFFAFPQVAAACCAQKGCYESIQAGLQKINVKILSKSKTESNPPVRGEK